MMTLKQIFDRTSTVEPGDEFRLGTITFIIRSYFLLKNSIIVIKQLEENENGFRDVLKEVFFSESNLIVLDCEKQILADVLMQVCHLRN